jgi:hypothetical protein
MLVNFSSSVCSFRLPFRALPNDVYYVADSTEEGFRSIWKHMQEDFFCRRYFRLCVPFSCKYSNPVDYFNSDATDPVLARFTSSMFADQADFDGHFEEIVMKSRVVQKVFPSSYTCDFNTMELLGTYGFIPLFLPDLFTGLSLVQSNAVRLQQPPENKTNYEIACVISSRYATRIDPILVEIQSVSLLKGATDIFTSIAPTDQSLLPPTWIMPYVTVEILLQRLQSGLPFCNPSMYPSLFLNKFEFRDNSNGKYTQVASVDEYFSNWLELKLRQVAYQLANSRKEQNIQAGMETFLLCMGDMKTLGWFIWSPKKRQEEWINENVGEDMVAVIDNVKLKDISTLLSKVMKYESMEEDDDTAKVDRISNNNDTRSIKEIYIQSLIDACTMADIPSMKKMKLTRKN